MAARSSVTVNGTTLSYTRHGAGPPVLLIAPAASNSGIWNMYQVSALTSAGYEVITFENRGTSPSSVPNGPYRLAELVADTAGLIRTLGIGPCRIAGASLGALIAQELALVRPDLVAGIALMGTRGRMTHFLTALSRGAAAAARNGDRVPPVYSATAGMTQLFAPGTLIDDKFAGDWLEVAEAFPVYGEGPAAQYDATITPDRLDALSGITCPALVMGFTQDVIMPVTLGREVAAAIPGSRYVEMPECGHFGFLERPNEVNRLLIEFFSSIEHPGSIW